MEQNRHPVYLGNNKLLVRKANRVEPNDALERAEAAIKHSVYTFGFLWQPDVGEFARFQSIAAVDCIDVEPKDFFSVCRFPSDLPTV